MEVSSSRPRTVARGRGRPAQALYMPPARRHRLATVSTCDDIEIETPERKESSDIKIMDVKTLSQQQKIDIITSVVQLDDLNITNHSNPKTIKSLSATIIDITDKCTETPNAPNTETQSLTMSFLKENAHRSLSHKSDSNTHVQSPLKILQSNTNNPPIKNVDKPQGESKKPLESHDREKEVKAITKNVKLMDVKCDVLQISVAKNIKKSPIKLVQVDQWEDLFNNEEENTACEKNVQNNECSNTANSYDSDNENLNDAQLEHILEIYDFPSSFKASDIMQIYNELDHNSVYIKWINETKALLVLGSAMQAKRALSIEHPFIKSRPVALGSPMALDVVRNCNLRPAMKRPPTSMQAARRMITTALGAKSQVSREVQQRERDALRKAKEERRTQRQNERDAWEGNPRPTTA